MNTAKRRFIAFVLATAIAAALLLSHSGSRVQPVAAASAATAQVIASGLNNPRGLNFGPEGALYVAEAGSGGDGACAEGPEGPRCYGPTGSVVRIEALTGAVNRVATGLPSLATEDGSFATGVHDIAFLGRGTAFMTIGFAGDPALRTIDFGAEGAGFARLAHLNVDGRWQLQEDFGAYEAAVNPTGDEVDSNPYGILSLPGRRVVTDAGANALNEVAANGTMKTLATFPDGIAEAPPLLELPPGTLIPMDTVPTSVALGPDGHFYVGQLTGFPFPVGGAKVYRIPAHGGTPEVFAEGFTAIIDIAFGADGSLYVLELAKNGLLDAFIFNDWTGALIRVSPDGTRTQIAEGALFAPGGVAVGPDGAV